MVVLMVIRGKAGRSRLVGLQSQSPEADDYFPPVSSVGGWLPPPPGPWKPYGLGGCPLPAAPLPTVAGSPLPTVAGWPLPVVADWPLPVVAGWLLPTVAG